MVASRDRALHLIDIENLTGAPVPSSAEVNRCWQTYAQHFIVRGDQVIVACSHRAAAVVWFNWGCAQRIRRSGPNGADLALLDAIEHQDVANRFERVYIGSGDGIFTEVARQLGAEGVAVTVVSRSQSLSDNLRRAADHVALLPATNQNRTDYQVAA